jgi:cyclophilin family peptidyl-prolyl cis-trans isomerase
MRKLFLCTTLALALTAGPALAGDSSEETAEPAAKKSAAEDVANEDATDKDEAIMQIDELIKEAAVDKSDPKWRTTLTRPEKATFDPSHTYYARMETNKGPILIKFMPDVAPMHVTSFIYLTRLGFYDGLMFHRVIPGFMAQGGCPLGTGTGGPGYKYSGEFSDGVKHDRPGLLSMANAGPGTDGSQFFLTFVPTAWLDGKHTIFGEVVEGTETLKALEKAGSPGTGRTKEKLVMEKVTIEVKPS